MGLILSGGFCFVHIPFDMVFDISCTVPSGLPFPPSHVWSYHIYPTPPLGQDMTQGQFFKRSVTGLNSEFSFS